MKYIAYIKQEGEGCDYTIACGETVIEIIADTLDNAWDKLLEQIEENYSGERSLESCVLYEVSNTEYMNLDKVYKHIEAKELQALYKKELEAEHKEYERLKNKFE